MLQEFSSFHLENMRLHTAKLCLRMCGWMQFLFARLILALDILQAGSGGYATEDILDLAGSDVIIP